MPYFCLLIQTLSEVLPTSLLQPSVQLRSPSIKVDLMAQPMASSSSALPMQLLMSLVIALLGVVSAEEATAATGNNRDLIFV
jgi:hypothetical protein